MAVEHTKGRVLAPRVFVGNGIFTSSRELTAKETVMTKLSDVVESTAIRPFQCECAGGGTDRIAQAHQRDKVA